MPGVPHRGRADPPARALDRGYAGIRDATTDLYRHRARRPGVAAELPHGGHRRTRGGRGRRRDPSRQRDRPPRSDRRTTPDQAGRGEPGPGPRQPSQGGSRLRTPPGSLREQQRLEERDLDAARAQAESSRSQVEAAQQALALTPPGARAWGAWWLRSMARSQASRSKPTRTCSRGQVVAVLASGSRPEVEVGIPGRLIGQIQESAGVEVSFDALPGTIFPRDDHRSRSRLRRATARPTRSSSTATASCR